VDHNVEDFLEIGTGLFLLKKGNKSLKKPFGFAAFIEDSDLSSNGREYSRPQKEGQPVISVKKLTQRYGDFTALDNLDLEIYSGELVAILGENGSGKTTLVKHFNGLLRPYSGNVAVKGLDTSRVPINELVKHTGLVFQNPDNMLFEDTVEAEISFGLTNTGISGSQAAEAIARSLELVNLKGKEKVFPRHLSRGERQRLAVACVIAMQPELIVLDEPTTGLDAEESDRMMKLMKRLQQEGHTIVMVTHNMQIVKNHAERVIRMVSGKIVEDSANEIPGSLNKEIERSEGKCAEGGVAV
jgi:energy-coupling factor transport system ATP-binding protein